jgi:hypothetical protein
MNMVASSDERAAVKRPTHSRKLCRETPDSCLPVERYFHVHAFGHRRWCIWRAWRHLDTGFRRRGWPVLCRIVVAQGAAPIRRRWIYRVRHRGRARVFISGLALSLGYVPGCSSRCRQSIDSAQHRRVAFRSSIHHRLGCVVRSHAGEARPGGARQGAGGTTIRRIRGRICDSLRPLGGLQARVLHNQPPIA